MTKQKNKESLVPIQHLYSKVLQIDDIKFAIEPDYTLRCISGEFKGCFVYINLTQEGEIIGSSQSCSPTLLIQSQKIQPLHCSIKFQYSEQYRDVRYILKNIGKGQIWVMVSRQALALDEFRQLKIDGQIFFVQYGQDLNQLKQWINKKQLNISIHPLSKHKLSHLITLQPKQLKALLNLSDSDTDVVFCSLEAFRNVQQFNKNYVAKKLKIGNEKKKLIECGFSGAILNNNLTIKYQMGEYFIYQLQQLPIFYKIKNDQQFVLMPDTTLDIGGFKFQVQKYNTGFFQYEGYLNGMEDRIMIRQQICAGSIPFSFFGVFDGHLGSQCAQFISINLIEILVGKLSNLSKNLIKTQTFKQNFFFKQLNQIINQTFLETDKFYQTHGQKIKQDFDCGSTACIVLIFGDYLVIANLGDSRAILSRKGNFIQLTKDHRVDNPTQQKRLVQNQIPIKNNRVQGKSMVTRAFGDFKFKKPIKKLVDYIIVQPEIKVIQLNFQLDQFIIVACDGVFDTVNSQNCMRYIRNFLKKMNYNEQDPQVAAESFTKYIQQMNREDKNYCDNLSIIIICLSRCIGDQNQ